MRELVVGTRGSALALVQTEIVCSELLRLDPSLSIRVERITTTGDTRHDIPLSQLGRGVFVTEIESALREGRIDFAVHSAKDLPSTLAPDLELGAILRRADARDVLVSRHGWTLSSLPGGARVGTSSPRRACQLRAVRPGLQACDVRGNVDTRLRKLAAGELDALVLAAAGLIRLGREAEITEWLDPMTMIPSVGQGALAVEVRADDERTVRLVRLLDHAETRTAVLAERAFLAELGAGCRAAAAAHARIESGRLRIVALIGSVDGRNVRSVRTGDPRRPEELGASIAHELLRAGGARFLARDQSALAGKTIAVTRAVEQSAELIALLEANGATTVSFPTIEIEPVRDNEELDAALDDLRAVDWIVFTSANAVHAVADRLSALSIRVPASVRLAAVGRGTGKAVSRRMRAADFIPSRADGAALGDELPDVGGAAVLFPRGDRAGDALPSRLRSRGALVRDVVVYRTIASEGAGELASRIRDSAIDAVLFASPSSARAAAAAGAFSAVAPSDLPAIVCIGPSTARAIRDLGFEPDAQAATQTVGALVEALENCLHERQRIAAFSSR